MLTESPDPKSKPIATLARRRLLRLLSLTGLTGCVSAQADTQPASNSRPLKTPAETEGPFYPVSWEGDVDANLVQLAGAGPYTDGVALKISGQVRRADGSAAAGAHVAIWQCDAHGRYRHPNDAGEAPAAAGFQGYGRTKADAAGRFAFATIKPIAYASRPAHVHFRVEDQHTRLITQMYFAGENEEKGLLARFTGWASDRTLLTVEPAPAADGNGFEARFDIYL